MYGGEMKVLVGYADADGSMAEDQCTISSYTFIVDGGAVSWSTKCQETVSLSTTESEYITTTHTAKEVLWLYSFDYASLQPSHSSHYSVLGQPVCNHAHKGPPILPMHQTH